MRNGRRLGPNTTPRPYQPPEIPEGRINLTDPDSRVVKGLRGFIQGYNAQAVTTEDPTPRPSRPRTRSSLPPK
jgi:hypothetical protein